MPPIVPINRKLDCSIFLRLQKSIIIISPSLFESNSVALEMIMVVLGSYQ